MKNNETFTVTKKFGEIVTTFEVPNMYYDKVYTKYYVMRISVFMDNGTEEGCHLDSQLVLLKYVKKSAKDDYDFFNRVESIEKTRIINGRSHTYKIKATAPKISRPYEYLYHIGSISDDGSEVTKDKSFDWYLKHAVNPEEHIAKMTEKLSNK